MAHEAPFLTRAELIGFATSNGISAAKVHRWINWGLLPKPEIKGFGYGLSTEARFPAEASKARLLEIAKALREDRDLAALQWRLWWQGTDVATDRVRRALARTVEQKAKEREKAIARQVNDEEWARFDQQNRRRVDEETGLRDVQAKMDKPSFVQLRKSLHEMTTDSLAKDDVEKTRSVFRQAFGPVMSAEAFDPGFISNQSNSNDWQAALNRATSDDLISAREELQTLIVLVSDACEKSPEASVGGFPAGILALMLSMISADMPRDLFLVWLTWWQNAGFRLLLPLVKQTFRLPMSEWSTFFSSHAPGTL